MPNQLPVSRVVAVSVNLTPGGAQAQSLSDILVLGTSGVIDPVEALRTYDNLADVAADFGTSAEEYLAARAWFAQSPQPKQIIIGRWVNAASKGGLRCGPLSASQQLLSAWTAVAAGSLKVTIDGGAATDYTAMDFSGATTLNGVAAIIQAAVAGVAVVWNPTYSRFEITSATTGPTSAVSFLSAAATGTDISAMLAGLSTSSGAYVFAGSAAVDVDAAVASFDDRFGQLWYALFVPSASDDDHELVGAYIEAASNKHIYGVGTSEGGVLVPATTSDIAYVLKALGFRRTTVNFNGLSIYGAVSMLARILTTDFSAANTVITLKFKTEPGFVADALSTTEANSAEGKNANVFVLYDNGVAIIEQGVMCDGTFVDIVTGTDWLALDIQKTVFNLLYTSPTKIPQTNAGVQLLQTGIESVCAQAVTNGLLAPGVWNATGFGQLKQGDYLQKGYYVFAASVDTQDPADRAARKSPPFQVAAKLAGAIHSADVHITVNQ